MNRDSRSATLDDIDVTYTDIVDEMRSMQEFISAMQGLSALRSVLLERTVASEQQSLLDRLLVFPERFSETQESNDDLVLALGSLWSALVKHVPKNDCEDATRRVLDKISYIDCYDIFDIPGDLVERNCAASVLLCAKTLQCVRDDEPLRTTFDAFLAAAARSMPHGRSEALERHERALARVLWPHVQCAWFDATALA